MHNVQHRLLCAEKASGRSFCSPYGAIVLVMPYNAPPQSLLLALLVENKLLVSQRRAGGLWTQKCVRCGAPMRVAGRFPPTASDKPAEGSRGNGKAFPVQQRRNSASHQGVFEKFERAIFFACNLK